VSVLAPRSTARVLVVDDEVGPRESLRMLLKTQYEVLTADNGPTALEEITRFRPDLVILDVRMPQMDGLEVLRRIKVTDPTVEVILITAYASLDTVKQALTLGAFEYLIKPFSRQDVEDTVRRALSRRRSELGVRGQVAMLVGEMRSLAAKARAMEEVARREAAEQSLRVTQLSVLREISRGIAAHLNPASMTATISEQLRVALGYDRVTVVEGDEPIGGDVVCPIRDAEGLLGFLVVDNRPSGRSIDRREQELLEMLAEYLAIALRNSRLYGEIANTKRSLEQIVATAAEGIIALDLADRVISWNQAATCIFGVSADDAIGQPIATFLPGEEYGRARRQLAADGMARTFDLTLRLDEGMAKVLSARLSPVWGSAGLLDSALLIVRDVTFERGLEAQVIQSEKLSALGQLAGGIAHDFNNQLQAILGYTQLMKRAPWDADLIQKALVVVEAAAQGGTETVRRIQEFARARPDEAHVPVDINQVVQDAIAITRPRWEEQIARRGIPLELKLDLAAVLPVSGRAAALGEVITNLILNALDAMPEGGTLSIATRQEGMDRVVVTVTDTGIGMPAAVRSRIFEPFFTTKGQRGSGLGLSVSYSIVQRHGGEIRVNSEVGRGTTFALSFPATSWGPDRPDAPALPRSRRPARILLVDNEPQVLSILSEMLRRVGHTVVSAESGDDALAAFAPGRYDVVLTNIGLGGMNGWQLADRIRRRDQDVGILFVTGWGLHDSEREQLRRLGVRGCLFKPVRTADLDAAVQDALPVKPVGDG
jgi:PAS domain S-box-containing protein